MKVIVLKSSLCVVKTCDRSRKKVVLIWYRVIYILFFALLRYHTKVIIHTKKSPCSHDLWHQGKHGLTYRTSDFVLLFCLNDISYKAITWKTVSAQSLLVTAEGQNVLVNKRVIIILFTFFTLLTYLLEK